CRRLRRRPGNPPLAAFLPPTCLRFAFVGCLPERVGRTRNVNRSLHATPIPQFQLSHFAVALCGGGRYSSAPHEHEPGPDAETSGASVGEGASVPRSLGGLGSAGRTAAGVAGRGGLMLAKLLLSQILHNDALTRGLGDEEARV